jgi:hypothetical protein
MSSLIAILKAYYPDVVELRQISVELALPDDGTN